MIQVIYDGNLGNNLFQYCFGRILAEALGYALSAKPIPGFPRTQEYVAGHDYTGHQKIILRGQKPDLSFMELDNPAFHVMLTGYFQRYEYYNEHLGDIRNWLRSDYPPIGTEISPDDVVVGIRRGSDYIPRHGLPISYYEEALGLLDYERVYITTNKPSDPFIRYFVRKYNAIVRPPGALDNLEFIRKFNKIIISNSSFLWWAAVLSDAGEIIFPRPANGFWSTTDYLSKNISLEIPESRYSYLKCEKYHSSFLSEVIKNNFDNIILFSKRIIRNVFPSLFKGYVRDPNSLVFCEEYEPPTGDNV